MNGNTSTVYTKWLKGETICQNCFSLTHWPIAINHFVMFFVTADWLLIFHKQSIWTDWLSIVDWLFDCCWLIDLIFQWLIFFHKFVYAVTSKGTYCSTITNMNNFAFVLYLPTCYHNTLLNKFRSIHFRNDPQLFAKVNFSRSHNSIDCIWTADLLHDKYIE